MSQARPFLAPGKDLEPRRQGPLLLARCRGCMPPPWPSAGASPGEARLASESGDSLVKQRHQLWQRRQAPRLQFGEDLGVDAGVRLVLVWCLLGSLGAASFHVLLS